MEISQGIHATEFERLSNGTVHIGRVCTETARAVGAKSYNLCGLYGRSRSLVATLLSYGADEIAGPCGGFLPAPKSHFDRTGREAPVKGALAGVRAGYEIVRRLKGGGLASPWLVIARGVHLSTNK